MLNNKNAENVKKKELLVKLDEAIAFIHQHISNKMISTIMHIGQSASKLSSRFNSF